MAMTADLKQKETEAWENVGRNDIRAAVSASIAAALAEALALERVARLEYRSTATATGVLPNGERVQCTECSGTTNSPSQFAWTCLDGRWRCETHSKPPAPCAASGDKPGETGAISPAATQGIPQSGPQAPERVTLKRSWSVNLWQSTNDGFGTEYVRADVHAKACIDSRRLGEEHVRLLDERGDFTEGSRPWRCEKELEKARTALASAERRIAELEAQLGLSLTGAEVPSPVPSNASMAAMAHDEDAPFPETVVHGKLDGRMRKYIPVDGTELQGQLDKARAEGREAGIREAAEAFDADLHAKGFQGRDYYRAFFKALLAKKPEVGT